MNQLSIVTYISLILFLLFYSYQSTAQQNMKGVILDSLTRLPLDKATIKYGSTDISTDRMGRFSIPKSKTNPFFTVSRVGYLSKDVKYSNEVLDTVIFLMPVTQHIDEVIVSTGYFSIPKERSTGSFSHINNEQLQSIVAGSLVDKMEGLVVGMDYDRSRSYINPINIRGVSTIESNTKPLIILDNFPYEGEMANINPNDVESITVLKDAAAASIWGARAGNGVIVIVSKSGRYSSPLQVSFTANNTLGSKPDLFYSQRRLHSDKQMEIEEINFNNGAYQIRNQTAIPLYIELLQAKKEQRIDNDEFERIKHDLLNTDIRSQAGEYLYQHPYLQQYALNIKGGDEKQNYFISANYDNNKSETIGDSDRRINLLLQHEFKLSRKATLKTGLRYTKTQGLNNGVGLESVFPTYGSLMGKDGRAAAFSKNIRFAYQQQAEDLGLLDWMYRPLEERDLVDRQKEMGELLTFINLRYKLHKYFDISALYQYNETRDKNWTYYQKESFYVRDLVNKFTQANGTMIIPFGDIWSTDEGRELKGHQARLQLDYQRVQDQWQINGLAGAEIKQEQYVGIPRALIYGYSPDTQTGVNKLDYMTRYKLLPAGSAQIPVSPLGVSKVNDRFVSYFGNVAVSWQNQLDFTGSIRWDASNLFGVKTNQKGIPLWSSGIAWNMNTLLNEQWNWLNRLRVSTTYGSSGNVNRSVSVYNIIRHDIDQVTNLPMATLESVGNPSLRWESVRTWNTALEFSMWNNRITSRLEYYIKKAEDLIGEDLLDPTTGINSTILPKVANMVNYASLNTKGIDWQVDLKVLRNTPFKWDMNFMFSKNTNKVTHYNMTQQNNANIVLMTNPPRVGESLNKLYALPWFGLDSQTGRTLLPSDEVGKTYREYYEKYPMDNLDVAGVTRAPYFGAVLQQLTYANFTLGVQLLWKAGHVFRRESMLPGYEFILPGQYHQDIYKRWQKPGDEVFTNVPAGVPYTNSTSAESYYEGQIYKYASILIEPADYIRLQNIQLSYLWQSQKMKNRAIKSMRILFNMRNVGILWKSNKVGADPDYPNTLFPKSRLSSVSLQMQF